MDYAKTTSCFDLGVLTGLGYTGITQLISRKEFESGAMWAKEQIEKLGRQSGLNTAAAFEIVSLQQDLTTAHDQLKSLQRVRETDNATIKALEERIEAEKQKNTALGAECFDLRVEVERLSSNLKDMEYGRDVAYKNYCKTRELVSEMQDENTRLRSELSESIKKQVELEEKLKYSDLAAGTAEADCMNLRREIERLCKPQAQSAQTLSMSDVTAEVKRVIMEDLWVNVEKVRSMLSVELRLGNEVVSQDHDVI